MPSLLCPACCPRVRVTHMHQPAPEAAKGIVWLFVPVIAQRFDVCTTCQCTGEACSSPPNLIGSPGPVGAVFGTLQPSPCSRVIKGSLAAANVMVVGVAAQGLSLASGTNKYAAKTTAGEFYGPPGMVWYGTCWRSDRRSAVRRSSRPPRPPPTSAVGA